MLPSKVVRHKAGRFLPVILAGLILAACSGQGPQTSTVNIQGPSQPAPLTICSKRSKAAMIARPTGNYLQSAPC